MLGEALNYLGSSLDKPGRAVRGLLSGNLREGLAAVPFSDALGMTDPSQRVSGRQLTDKMGLTRMGDKGWGSWSLGMGAEMATDPLSYLPAHSVFKALKPGDAAMHGLTATKSMGSQINASLGGSVRDMRGWGGSLAGGTHVPVAGGIPGQGLSQRLRSLREGTPVFKDYGSPRVVGAGQFDSRKLASAYGEWQDAHKLLPDMGGASMAPWWGKESPAAGTAAVWNPAAAREEILHSMTQRAADSGNISQLPLIARPAAHTYRMANATGSRTLTGLGSILDELSAKTMAARGTTGKLGAAMNFLLDPQAHRLYDPQFAAHGFIPRAAYHTLPYALPAGAAGAAGYALSGER